MSNGKGKASDAVSRRRTDEVLRILLDGAEFWDVCEYVREKEQEEGSPWHLAEGENPLSDSQIRRYIAKATALITASCRASTKILLRRHLARRRNLYAKAVSQGDMRTALAVLADEAKLLGLYAAERREMTGPGGGEIPVKVTHDVAADLKTYADVIRQFLTDPGGGDVPPHRLVQPVHPPPADPQADAFSPAL